MSIFHLPVYFFSVVIWLAFTDLVYAKYCTGNSSSECRAYNLHFFEKNPRSRKLIIMNRVVICRPIRRIRTTNVPRSWHVGYFRNDRLSTARRWDVRYTRTTRRALLRFRFVVRDSRIQTVRWDQFFLLLVRVEILEFQESLITCWMELKLF